jgi:hypothetical protein
MGKICWIVTASWYHRITDDTRIPKMPANNPQKALVHQQTQITSPAWIVNPQPQLLKIRLYGRYICKAGIVDYNLSSN